MIRYARQIQLAVGSNNVIRRIRRHQDTTKVPDIETGLVSLADLAAQEEEDSNFIVAVRIPPVPEYLVKGYEFKLLNKFVDFYVLSSDNLHSSDGKSTFHHSRLMGVSDINNADSLVDIITSLGVPVNKIILNVPAF